MSFFKGKVFRVVVGFSVVVVVVSAGSWVVVVLALPKGILGLILRVKTEEGVSKGSSVGF
jgi:hypothetical protein